MFKLNKKPSRYDLLPPADYDKLIEDSSNYLLTSVYSVAENRAEAHDMINDVYDRAWNKLQNYYN